MGLPYSDIIFAYVISGIGLIYGVAIVLFFLKLREKPETVMAKFKLNKQDTIGDFRRMVTGNILRFFAMFIMVLGSSVGNQLIINVAYVAQATAASFVAYTIAGWVRDYGSQ